MSDAPRFHSIDRSAIDALLARHHVGRLAFTFRDRVDCEPVHYVFADGWIYLRTGAGTKLDTLAHQPWVAFEVDEVRGLFDWESVVVRGRIERPEAEGTPAEQARHAAGIAALRRLVPDAFTAADPTPHRDVVLALCVDDVEGRRAEPATSSARTATPESA